MHFKAKLVLISTSHTIISVKNRLIKLWGSALRGIESLKCVREFYTPVCYCGKISMPQNVMLNETN